MWMLIYLLPEDWFNKKTKNLQALQNFNSYTFSLKVMEKIKHPKLKKSFNIFILSQVQVHIRFWIRDIMNSRMQDPKWIIPWSAPVYIMEFVILKSKSSILTSAASLLHFKISVADPGCLSRIRILPSRIPDPGSKRFRIPDPQRI